LVETPWGFKSLRPHLHESHLQRQHHELRLTTEIG
jgi:hypothetical protein